jgi:hypothetical protein
MHRALGALVVAVLLAAPARAEIYRWVDADGVTHLDDTLENVPEGQRPDAKVFQARVPNAAPASAAQGATQAAFANGVARELGLIAVETQDAVSALHIVGVYPSTGWHPSATLTSAVVEEVVRAARAAARARRLPQAEGAAEAAVLRVSSSLGVAGPPPTVVAAPAPAPEPPTVIVAPNIVVEAPPSTVVVNNVERQREPVLTQWGWDPGFGGGIPFAPIPNGRVAGPIPDRITPLSNPAGHLHGPAVPPRPRPGPFRRPPTF